MIIGLDKLKKGESGCVCAIDAAGGMRRRFMDIGVIRGAEVECVGISPLGDPRAYKICGAVIAIRREDAANIKIEVSEELCEREKGRYSGGAGRKPKCGQKHRVQCADGHETAHGKLGRKNR